MTILAFLRENARWLGAGALLTFLSSFGQTFFISIFAGEIREAFQLSHGSWGAIYSIGTTASAIVMIWAGGLSDRMRARSLGISILAVLAAACIFMAWVPVWWLLPLAVFFLRFAGQGMCSHIAMVAMARWFTATRGRALAIATLGFSVGEAILPLAFVALMTVLDWRLLWLISAVICVAGIPLLITLLQHERTPSLTDSTSQTPGMENRHWTRNQAMRHPLFWFMMPSLLGPSAFITAFFFHQVHFAEIKGLAHVEFVAMFPFYTVISIAAMLAGGIAVDRFGAWRTFPFVQIPIILGFVVFAMAEGVFGMLVGFFFFSLTAGANASVPPAFWAEFYGTRHIGSVKAMAAAIMVLGSAIGPALTGYGIDAGLGIETQYVLVGGYFVIAVALMVIGISRARPSLPAAA